MTLLLEEPYSHNRLVLKFAQSGICYERKEEQLKPYLLFHYTT